MLMKKRKNRIYIGFLDNLIELKQIDLFTLQFIGAYNNLTLRSDKGWIDALNLAYEIIAPWPYKHPSEFEQAFYRSEEKTREIG